MNQGDCRVFATLASNEIYTGFQIKKNRNTSLIHHKFNCVDFVFINSNNFYQTCHKITIFDTIKRHYLLQFKDAQRKVQQNREMAPERWYTMLLLNISDISSRWNICRAFPYFNWYDIRYFHNGLQLTDTKYLVCYIIFKAEVGYDYRNRSLSWKMFNSIKYMCHIVSFMFSNLIKVRVARISFFFINMQIAKT